METIQEYCLDELLGISKKRLQSIINATKCPENTDSSDSDVENIEGIWSSFTNWKNILFFSSKKTNYLLEHISLEEISSDSADDAMRVKKPKGKGKVDEDIESNVTKLNSIFSLQQQIIKMVRLVLRAQVSNFVFNSVTNPKYIFDL